MVISRLTLVIINNRKCRNFIILLNCFSFLQFVRCVFFFYSILFADFISISKLSLRKYILTNCKYFLKTLIIVTDSFCFALNSQTFYKRANQIILAFLVHTSNHVRLVTVPPRALAQSYTSDRLCDQFYWRRF